MKFLCAILFMVLICNACNRNDFKSQQGLSKHRTKCKNVVSQATLLLENRRHRILRQEDKERRRKERGDIREGMGDYEMGVPEAEDGNQVCYINLSILSVTDFHTSSTRLE